MYGERAALYDPIYHWKDYGAESARLREFLRSLEIPDGARVLEVACGTGSHLAHLRAYYQASGLDLSDAMLSVARTKLPPEVALRCADMADFEVAAPVDALLCLFSSIGYVHPEARLRATARCFARAVRPGGALVIEPWLTPEAYRPGRMMMQTYDGEDLKLCRASVSKQEGELAVLDFHWLVLRAGAAEPERFVERHELWLCPAPLMRAILDDAGFDVHAEPAGLSQGRGLLIGRRRA